MIWSFILAIWGCVGLWLIGSGHAVGWKVNLALQFAWFVFAVATAQYGFILGSAAYGFVNFRNMRRAASCA